MRPLVRVVVAAGACGALFTPALAVPAMLGARDQDGRPDGLPLLAEAVLAAAELPYHGTQVISMWSPAGTTSAVVEVTHVPGAGTMLRAESTPIRSRSVVFRPDSPAGGGVHGSGLDAAALALIAANYEADIVGVDSIAGRPADVVLVHTAVGTPVARFWLDRHTRLVLRQQTFDGAGSTVRESAYIDISFNAWLGDRAAMQTAPAAAGEPVALEAVGSLRQSGWQVPVDLGTGLRLFDVRFDRARGVLHLSYHDGVSGASVFQQRGRLDDGALDGWRRQQVGGAEVWVGPTVPATVAWSSRGIVYTVVADNPHPVLESLVRVLPHGEPRRGVLTRMRRGLGRVGSWFNPFG